MFPFVLYLVAGLITGFHVYSLLLLSLYGSGFNALHLLALVGSLGLIVAAYVSLFRPARIALIACLAIWSFYGPGIANLVRSKIAIGATHKLFRGTFSTRAMTIESGAVGERATNQPRRTPFD